MAGADLNRMKVRPGKARPFRGHRSTLDKVIDIDQSPIGRTPRSNLGHLHRAVQGHPGPFASTPTPSPGDGPGPVLLQREGRPVRVLRRGWTAEDRDALPAGHLRPLRGVQGQAVQPGDPGGPVQGQEHRRRAEDDRGRGLEFFAPCRKSGGSWRPSSVGLGYSRSASPPRSSPGARPSG